MMAVDDSYTKSLLHFDGADASTTFTDESGKTWTAAGDAQIDTAQSKFGGASGLFDGTGDYITTPDSDDFHYSNGDFTIDFWVRFNVVQTTTIYHQMQDVNNETQLFYDNSTNRLQFYEYSGGAFKFDFYASWTPSNSTWYHVAIVRSGNTPLMFVDGVSKAVTESTTISGKTLANISAVLTLGRNALSGTQHLNGWMDEFRVSKGIARWTGTFAPPSSAYPLNGFFLFF